jgi:asparagine synthase (glutamine-hydrolysing)
VAEIDAVAVGDFLGCYGRVAFDVADRRVSYVRAPFGQRVAPAPGVGAHAVQWLRPGAAAAIVVQPADQEYLLLSGAVTGPVSQQWVQRIATALKQGRYAELARVPGEVAGCLITPGRVFLFRSATSNEGLLYRRDGMVLRWSSDPTELLDEGSAEFDRQALWRCCRRDMVLIYHNLRPVQRGQLVIVDKHQTTSVHYDRIIPMELPRRTSLAQYAEIAYSLILQAVRPYARSGQVGILLSGGLDSATVLTALVEVGADVVAYHMAPDDPLADESSYAGMVCKHLGVPFAPIRVDCGEDYLSDKWVFPHPYNSLAFQWLEKTADRIQRDQITFLIWGRDGDMVFGPERYGLRDVLFGDLRLQEKMMLCRGLVSSRWELPRILRSIGSASLLDDYEAVGDNARGTDFLNPEPDVVDDRFDYDYSAIEHTADLTCWRPRGIQLCSPLGDKDIQRLTTRMPNAYRLLPHRGRMISKPVLRLILSTRLPATIWRRYGRLWLDNPHKNYVLAHPQVFAELIGKPDSHLVQMGVVDPQRLAHVLAEPLDLRRHADTLICAAMTELFLRSRAEQTVVVGKG